MARASGRQQPKERPFQKIPIQPPVKVEPVGQFEPEALDTARVKLFTFRKCGLAFKVEGDKLLVRGKLSELDRQNIANWKAEIIELIRREASARRDQATEKHAFWTRCASRQAGYNWQLETDATRGAWTAYEQVVAAFVNEGEGTLEDLHAAFVRLAKAHKVGPIAESAPVVEPDKKKPSEATLPLLKMSDVGQLPAVNFAIDITDTAWRHAWFKEDFPDESLHARKAVALEHVFVKRGLTNAVGQFHIKVLAAHRAWPYWFRLDDVDLYLAVGDVVEEAHQTQLDRIWTGGWNNYFRK